MQLSTKPKPNKPFGSEFYFIEATFDVSNLADLRHRPAAYILERLREQLLALLVRGPGLLDLANRQELVGPLTFCARFIPRGRAGIISAYACLAAAEHLKRAKRLVMISKEMISKEMIENVAGLWREITNGAGPRWWYHPPSRFLGCRGRPPTPAGPSKRDRGARVRGIRPRAMGATSGKLIQQRRISINALELLAAAAAVILVDEAARISTWVAIRAEMRQLQGLCGCQLWVATSAAVGEALRIWHAECERREQVVRLLYVDRKSSGIAHALSWTEVTKQFNR